MTTPTAAWFLAQIEAFAQSRVKAGPYALFEWDWPSLAEHLAGNLAQRQLLEGETAMQRSQEPEGTTY